MNAERMVMGDILASGGWGAATPESREWLVRLLRDEGVDLLNTPPGELQRGTPVYVESTAPVLDVQRLMATAHIRFLPVVRDQEVVGIVDLVELAMADLEPGETIGEVTPLSD